MNKICVLTAEYRVKSQRGKIYLSPLVALACSGSVVGGSLFCCSQLFVRVLCLVRLCNVVLSVLSSFAIVSLRKRKLVALL